MKRKNIFFSVFSFLILFLIGISIAYSLALSNDQNYFLTLPFLNEEQTSIIFELAKEPENLYFSLKGIGANAYEKLSPFCKDRSCSIPMIIGMYVAFELIDKKKTVFAESYKLPSHSMNCTDEPWTNRICTFHNICYKENSFVFESPYAINFENEFLCLGSKTPPVDLDLNRMINKFKTVRHLPAFSIPRVKGPSNLVSIYFNMNMLWHTNFDFLLPLYQTLTLSYDLDYERKIFVPDFVPEIPELAKSLSKYPIEKLNRNLCFNDITIGMVKITDLALSKTDPPYSFCSNCSFGLRKAVLNYYNISDDNKDKLRIVFLGRAAKIRRILNEKEIVEALKQLPTDPEVKLCYFEKESLRSQVEIISNSDIFISAHGSGLANLLWMKPGSTVIEIMPKDFVCRDWYEKAARAAGLNYFAYFAKKENETFDGNELGYSKCMSKRNRCLEKECIDILRDRNMKLDPSQFIKEVSDFLKSKDII